GRAAGHGRSGVPAAQAATAAGIAAQRHRQAGPRRPAAGAGGAVCIRHRGRGGRRCLESAGRLVEPAPLNTAHARRSRPRRWRLLLPLLGGALLAACGGGTRPEPPPAVAPATSDPMVAPPKIGLALGGGAAKGFAHIGVIKMLEANGLRPDVVAGTSAGSVV